MFYSLLSSRNKFFRIFTLIILLSISACNGSGASSDSLAYTSTDSYAKQSPSNPPSKSENNQADQIAIDKSKVQSKIIKDGNIEMQVDNLAKSKSSVINLVKKYQGYISEDIFQNSDWESNYQLKIRIPTKSFEKFISDLENKGGQIKYKNIQARDVTEEYIDLESRLKNKNEYLKRYRDLLRQAHSIQEILDIEEKIRGIEEEIESTTGKLKYLNDQVDYSTLDLNLLQKNDFKFQNRVKVQFWERLKESISGGWYGFISFVFVLLRLWPFAIVLFLIVYLYKRYKKKKKANLP